MDLSPQAREKKAKLNKLDLIKLKSCCTAKKNIWQNKKQHTEWEMFSNDVSDKGLISKMFNKLVQFNIKKKNLIKNGQKT